MPHRYDVISSTARFAGRVISVRTDVVRMPGGDTAERDVVEHPGAVGVVALDDDRRVLLIRQYRHPVGRALWELPAGLRDVAGEPDLETARRELLEEAGLRAGRWEPLVAALASPGMTDEQYVVFLARDLTEVPAAERPELEHEELDLETAWVPLADACDRVLAGDIENALCIIGVLAAARRLS